MDFSSLQSSLTPVGSTVSISTGTLPPPFSDFLESCYFKQGKQLVISNAQVSADAGRGVMTITGRANILGAANLPVTASFSLSPAGDVQAVLRYTLQDLSGAQSSWKFSDLLPELPREMSPRVRTLAMSTGLSSLQARQAGLVRGDEPPLLDQLSFLGASLLVTTGAHTDPDTQVQFEGGGIHFLGQLKPASLLGPLGALMPPTSTVTVRGEIRVPRDQTELVLPSLLRDPTGRMVYPWEVQTELPGVHLQTSLGLNTQLGKLELRDTALRIFSPLSDDMVGEEPSQPLAAVTGRFIVPSANVDIEAIIRLTRESLSGATQTNLMIETRCSGLSIGNLAHMADLVGSGDSASSLPRSLTRVLEGLEKLELTNVSLAVSAGLKGLGVSWASFEIGAPGCRWSVWKDAFGVENLGLRISVTDPFGVKGARAIQTSIWGTALLEGVPIMIRASTNGEDFDLDGALMSKQALPLAGLMKTWTPLLPAPANLTINQLRVSIQAGKSFRLSGALADKPEPWKIHVGPGTMAIQNVAFDLLVPAAGDATGSFRGDIAFSKDVMLSMVYNQPGSFVLRAECDKLSLRGLASTLSNQKVWLPDGFDVTLLDSSILISGSSGPQGSLALQLATQVQGLGNFAFEARERSAGSWGFAAGMDLGASKPSALPGLSALAAFERMLRLQKLMLVIATYDDARFQFPDLAQFQNPRLGSGKVSLPGQAGGLVAGLNLFAEWSLDNSDKVQKMLAGVLGLGSTLGVTLQVSEKESRLFFRVNSRLAGQSMTGVCGVVATSSPGAAPQLSWFLTGSMTTKIQGQPQTFDVTMLLTSGGAFFAGTMKGSAPINCGPFKLSNLALEIGVNWGGIPSLGIAATIDVKKFESSVAVFFDSTDPSRSLVAGSISSLTAKDVLDTLVGGNLKTPVDEVLKGIAIKGTHEFTIPGSGPDDLTDELDGRVFDKIAAAFAAAKVTIPSSSTQLHLTVNKKGSAWHLTDLSLMRHYELKKSGDKIKVSVAPQFYFAPQPTSIGTLKFPQAFYLNAAISFVGFDASATIDISQNKGFSIQAQMDKIQILDEKVFSIAALQGGGGPKISVSTFNQPDNPEEKFRPPHFYINGSLTMLGVKQGIYASVTVQGIEFELVGNLVPGVHFDLDARFGRSGIGANGKVKVGVGTIDLGALGKAKINTQLEVEVDIDIDNPARAVSVGANTSWPKGATLLENEIATLTFQSDGNLVIYDTTGTSWVPTWASNTHGRGGSTVSFQGDGNLVIYTEKGQPIWASNTNGQGATKLSLQSNGNASISNGAGKALWSAGKGDAGGPSIELESSFEFAGQRVDLGRFRVEVKPDTFTQLPKTVEKKVEQALRDMFNDMNKWANAVSDGVMDGVTDTEKVFKDVYKKSEKEAKALAKGMNKGVNQATKTVEKTAKSVEKGTKKVIKKAKFW